jgi:hypothetical protein
MDDTRLAAALASIERRAVGTNMHLADLKTGVGQIHAMCVKLVAWTQEPAPGDTADALRTLATVVAGLDAKLDALTAKVDAMAARLPPAA